MVLPMHLDFVPIFTEQILIQKEILQVRGEMDLNSYVNMILLMTVNINGFLQ